MKFQQILQVYESKMTQVYLFQRAMRELAKRELLELDSYERSVKQTEMDISEMASAHHSMAFRTARDGDYRFFGSKKISIEERRISVFLHKNKQYQWLLAEAYEQFEDILEDLYAWAGYRDFDFWPLRDYGNITLSEIEEKPYKWFQDQARKKKDIPRSILNTFRDRLPEINSLEAENALGVNLRLAITLIQFLRHTIVHQGGTVSDLDKFTRRVLEGAGLYNNGNFESSHEDLVKGCFFAAGEYRVC